MMDYSRIVAPLLNAYWWIILLAIVIGILRLPVVKGYFGELWVRLFAKLLLDKEVYHRIDNVTLPTPDGTTQIDHIFVSRFGIFVVETKNMRGWIFGGENQAQWTQKIFKQSFKFQNPLRQNFKHAKALEATLQVPPNIIHSVVTFVGGSTFKTPMPANVTYGAGFIPYIKSFREPVLDEMQVTDLLGRIETGRLAPTLAVHREHVRNLKTRSNPDAARNCPKCGSPLVLRTVKSGERAGQKFWGCSSFPKCRVIQNVS